MQTSISDLSIDLAEGEILLGPETLDGPLDHLAYALGSCLLHFADRFLERRGLPRKATVNLEWTLDQRTCRMEGITVNLSLESEIGAGDQHVLEKLLGTCPVHQALEPGTPLALSIHSQGIQAPRLWGSA